MYDDIKLPLLPQFFLAYLSNSPLMQATAAR
jgi:hypothetical protein